MLRLGGSFIVTQELWWPLFPVADKMQGLGIDGNLFLTSNLPPIRYGPAAGDVLEFRTLKG